jgi:hypothetical protein
MEVVGSIPQTGSTKVGRRGISEKLFVRRRFDRNQKLLHTLQGELSRFIIHYQGFFLSEITNIKFPALSPPYDQQFTIYV